MKRIFSIIFILVILAGVILYFASESPALTIKGSKHDLSATGPGPVKAVTETQICIFCHIPHFSVAEAQAPLWNRIQPVGPWQMYNSDYLIKIGYTTPTAPTDRTKLCLSCHDGTIAVGTLSRKGPISMTGNWTAESLLGTDLRDDHPVSIKYDPGIAGANLKSPGPPTYPTQSRNTMQIKLYETGTAGNLVECTSCHNPHDNANTKFLVEPFYNGNVDNFCNKCHNVPNWAGSAHRLSTATFPAGSVLLTYGSNVGAVSCMNCHKIHTSPGVPYLRRAASYTQTCYGPTDKTAYPCHAADSSITENRVGAQFAKTYRHPISATDATTTNHKGSNESQTDLQTRHVECVDCHNPHQAKTQSGHQLATSGDRTTRAGGMIPIRGSLVGAWGVYPTGTTVDGKNNTGWPTFTQPYSWSPPPWSPPGGVPSGGFTKHIFSEDGTIPSGGNDGRRDDAAYLCLKCHSRYAFGDGTIPTVTTPSGTYRATDVTANFNPRNYTYHPVFMRGQNRPGSLNVNFDLAFMNSRGIWSDSYITCYDCHASDTATDPRGPHGSARKWLLRSNETGIGDGIPTNFCLNCHYGGTYGDEGPSAPAGGGQANTYSRYPHDYSRVNASDTAWGIASCMGCHGGDSYGGIHGSSVGVWPGKGPRVRSHRMLNGALWLGSSEPTTSSGPKCWVTSGANETTFDTACRRGHTGNVTGSAARYNYPYQYYSTD